MNLAEWIQTYGYFAVFLGTVLEGESVLLLAGYAAHQNLLKLDAVLVVAWLGASLGDQAYFWLGRWAGSSLIARLPKLQPKIEQALHIIERHPRKAIFSMRFLWGLRIALPLALGMSRVDWRLFMLLNLLAALLWAGLIGGLGYLFGEILSRWLGEVHRIEHWLVLGLALLGLLLYHLWQRTRAP